MIPGTRRIRQRGRALSGRNGHWPALWRRPALWPAIVRAALIWILAAVAIVALVWLVIGG
jgi:hypothetical protein